MFVPSSPPNKIPDESLRLFASSDSEDRASVLIELDLSEPQVKPQLRHFSGGHSRWRPAEVMGESAGSPAEDERKTRETGQFLGEILGKTPRWMSAAHVYSADVTASQLRRIVEAPNILAIHPNRPVGRNPGV